jgi:large subunit ribosomal protein L25
MRSSSGDELAHMIYELNAALRKETGKRLASLRASGLVPAVIYGGDVKENINLSVVANDFKKVYAKAGESALLNLTIEGEKKPRKVLIKEVSYHPVKDQMIHADFYQIKEGQKLEVEVILHFVGESNAVKNLGGILVKNLNSLTVRCLPDDMLQSYDVDIAKLATMDSKIKVSDLLLPKALEVMNDANDVVATVAEPEKEEVVAPAATAATAEAGAAGAAPAPGAAAPAAEAGKEAPKKEKK